MLFPTTILSISVLVLCSRLPETQGKNESCVTQANTVYPAKAKFILCQIDPWIN